MNIRQLKIFGERNTGTNAVTGDAAVVITASTKDPGLDWNYYHGYYCGEAWRAAFSGEDLEFCATAINWDLAVRFGYKRIASNSGLGPPRVT